MGLRIIDSRVVVDHSCKEHLHTELVGNPTVGELHGLKTFSVFKRLKNSAKQSRKRHEKIIGDNCPLIYALKGIDGLYTDTASIKHLYEHFPAILGQIIDQIDTNISAVVALPSRFPLADMLARRIKRNTNLTIFHDVFRKSTNDEACSRVENLLLSAPKSISHKDEKALRNTIKKLRSQPQSLFSAKDVPTKVRSYFDPLQPKTLHLEKDHQILLVDDLLASGETFRAATELLDQEGYKRPEQAVTWFSQV